ncbi:MAG TPA: hypothetical protein PKI85_07455 [Chitinophagaceae bacterium]|nr:hypothetical protein [Chitinophagaceae bacterium]HNO54935.1 hypothetical protein [Chitinophagaceae bacterium]
MKKNLMLFAVAAGLTTTTFAQKEEKENKMKIDPPAAEKLHLQSSSRVVPPNEKKNRAITKPTLSTRTMK